MHRVQDWTDLFLIKCRDGLCTCGTDNTAPHERAEMNMTSGGEKRDGSGGRVSLLGHQ